jgi:hypothetical protein
MCYNYSERLKGIPRKFSLRITLNTPVVVTWYLPNIGLPFTDRPVFLVNQPLLEDIIPSRQIKLQLFYVNQKCKALLALKIGLIFAGINVCNKPNRQKVEDVPL